MPDRAVVSDSVSEMRCPSCNSRHVKRESEESMSVDGRMVHWSHWVCIWCKDTWVVPGKNREFLEGRS